MFSPAASATCHLPKVVLCQRNGDVMRPVSARAGPTELPAKGFFLIFFSFFPKRKSWNEADLMGNESRLFPSLGTCCFCSRVTVSDSSCHFQCSLLVPESVPDILPQHRLLCSLMNDRKLFQSQFKAPYLGEGEKKAKQIIP